VAIVLVGSIRAIGVGHHRGLTVLWVGLADQPCCPRAAMHAGVAARSWSPPPPALCSFNGVVPQRPFSVLRTPHFLWNPPGEPSDDGFPRNILCRVFGRPLAGALYTVVTAMTSCVWIRCVEMPTSAPSALHTALRDSRIVGPARDARRVIFCGVHGQGRGKSPAVSSAEEAVGDDQ